ncbi:hypothetical protein [Flectobacillus major]|uniref:hypothetical protein n=1 Tax=Flectobacillus major TaxID=103 RepID=UPI000409FEB4|nr:hypothetical protein [Flectobacillus major]
MENSRNYNELGFSQSVEHGGHATGLETNLIVLRNEHILKDDSSNASIQQEINNNDNAILQHDKDKITAQKEIQSIEEVKIPSRKERIEQNKEKRHQYEKALHEGQKPDEVNRFELYRLRVVMILASIYLFGFYVSSSYMAFFRSVSEAFTQQTREKVINTLFQSVFSADAFATLNFHWLIPIVFLLFATIVENLMKRYTGKKRIVFTTVVIIAVFIFDAIIAYKIETTNESLKQQMGFGDPNYLWWKDVTFYGVLMLGFVPSLLLSASTYFYTKELEKIDGKRIIRLEIERITMLIEQLYQEIDELKIKVQAQQTHIAQLELSVVHLQKTNEKLLSRVSINKPALDKALNEFYDGWIKIFPSMPDAESKRAKCDEVYKHFRQTYLGNEFLHNN